jgi:hypothetical protein
MGRGDVRSRSSEPAVVISASSGLNGWATSFTQVLTGVIGASGGNSRTGELEQFGPWQGCLSGFGVPSPSGIGRSILVVEEWCVEPGGAFRIPM